MLVECVLGLRVVLFKLMRKNEKFYETVESVSQAGLSETLELVSLSSGCCGCGGFGLAFTVGQKNG